MKRALLVLPLLLLASCGGSDKADTVDNSPPATATKAPESATPVVTPTGAPIDPGVLSKAVLTLQELPAGYTVSTPADNSEDDDFCGVSAARKEPKNRADAAFAQSSAGPFIIERIDLFDRKSDATSVLAGIRDGFKKCGPTWADTGTPPTTWNVAALSFPKLGDETFAVRLTTTNLPIFGTAEVDYVYIRRGPALTGLAWIAIGPSALFSPLEATAKKADARITKAGIR